ncbi:MAG: type II toxin-antitoxin system HicA family toxin [Verrucomicrobia bacterium]|nr:type II toxin-antitoxin system HicA family toxin [Verrucomicrobiota bacterium]
MSKERSHGGKIPRNVSGSDLVVALKVLGYQTVRQAGSHLRLTTQQNGTHHVTVPAHRPIKTGTLLGGILKPVAAHHKISVDELLQKLDL